MESVPTVSVIVPVYKVEAYLRRCVDSILNQSYGDFELILVDDGSPDACPDICDEYEARDSRVHVIHQSNGGLSAARNAGIDWAQRNSDSRWLTFIDSDDWVHRDYLQVLFRGTRTGAGISACSFARTGRYLEDAALPEGTPLLLASEEAYDQYYGLMMTACCKLVRKDLYETLRFPVGKLHEDGFVTHFLVFAAETVAITGEKLYYYYGNPQSITRVKWNPRRLDELQAHEQRLAYLQVRGYETAYRREMEVYVTTIYEHTEVLARLSRHHKKCRYYLKNLRRKLRSALKLAGSLGVCPRNRENLWIYLMAGRCLPLWRLGKKLQALRHPGE